MKCPSCREPELVMSARQNIEIDYCPQCRGVWLDRGELDKLIERSIQETGTAQAAPPPQPQGRPYRDDDRDRQYRDHDRDHGRGYDRGYRKKSFWHEIFD
ncbi:Transcription factor zinc-finger domain-containing protein [Bordetella sputigena]|uniref:TFIIB-type zinc ribbon-containing protein n=1 Tax=Bordetella sputigena TaxID=1416810 RepID=UPI0039F0CEA0